MQQVVWFVNESDSNCWNFNFCWKQQKNGKSSHQEISFFFSICFHHNTSIFLGSSYTENFLKFSKHYADFPFRHSEINSSIFSLNTANLTFDFFFLKRFTTQVKLRLSLPAYNTATDLYYFQKRHLNDAHSISDIKVSWKEKALHLCFSLWLFLSTYAGLNVRVSLSAEGLEWLSKLHQRSSRSVNLVNVLILGVSRPLHIVFLAQHNKIYIVQIDLQSCS